MTRYVPDDRRYMPFEIRAIDDPRYRGEIEDRAPVHRTCRCGKTVVEVQGRPVMLDGKPVTCPRRCEEER